MGDQRERNRIKSRVDELPDEIRAQLDTMLADVNYTYQDIADTITDLGYEISRSAVGRYAMRHNSAARRLKEASEQTTALLQFIRENQDVESTELASAIMIDGLTRRIATADEDWTRRAACWSSCNAAPFTRNAGARSVWRPLRPSSAT